MVDMLHTLIALSLLGKLGQIDSVLVTHGGGRVDT
jgi:hypothetical protein